MKLGEGSASRDLEIFTLFASQVSFRRHLYVFKDANSEFQLTSQRSHRCLQHLKELIQRALVTAQSCQDLSHSHLLHDALYLVTVRLEKKLPWNNWLGKLFSSDQRVEQIQSLLQLIGDYQRNLPPCTAPLPLQEPLAFLHFFRDFHLHTQSWNLLPPFAASPQELLALRAISRLIWERVVERGGETAKSYWNWLALLFQGNHLLIEEEEGEELFSLLQQTGARPLKESLYEQKTPLGQFNLTGPLAHSLLFGKVPLSAIPKGGTSAPFTWIQLDKTPNGPRLRDFLKKRWIDAPRERWLQKNVGPYGWGRNQEQPQVLKKSL